MQKLAFTAISSFKSLILNIKGSDNYRKSFYIESPSFLGFYQGQLWQNWMEFGLKKWPRFDSSYRLPWLRWQGCGRHESGYPWTYRKATCRRSGNQNRWWRGDLRDRKCVQRLHCPRFGPDRTEPTGPGFGPLRGRTGPKFTGPRSRAQWTGPEGRTRVGPEENNNLLLS